MPNLVQTLENNPAFVHGGPFANIAHGCNSVIATKTALKLADYVVTEAGFGADLGAEKFFDIKCRKAGLKPAAAVIVATVRALKMHGGVAQGRPRARRTSRPSRRAAPISTRHLENVRKFGVPAVVAINQLHHRHRQGDRRGDEGCAESAGAKAILCTHWAEGGKGTEALARQVVDAGRRRAGQVQAALSRRDAAAGTRSRPSPPRSTAPPTSPPTRRSATSFKELQDGGLRPPARSAWPRRSIRFSTDPNLQRRARPATSCRSARSALRRRRVRRRHLRRDHDHAGPAARCPSANVIRLNEKGQIEGCSDRMALRSGRGDTASSWRMPGRRPLRVGGRVRFVSRG